ncbi:hypothetical protein SAMN05519104_5159 [Rhizobiales bacterium GAS188]|nr:hypothetical protein SAMN05519104_5159 [Rhizobiales bacterium GAS188]
MMNFKLSVFQLRMRGWTRNLQSCGRWSIAVSFGGPPALIRSLLLVLALALGSGTVMADDLPCYPTFYQTKNIRCIDGLVSSLSTLKSAAPDAHTGIHSNIEGAVGFLARLFHDHPEERRRLLTNSVSVDVKGIYIESLYRAGLTWDARTYADANSLSELFKGYMTGNLSSIRETKSTYIASVNDLLIGAYFASGDLRYINNILTNYTTLMMKW